MLRCVDPHPLIPCVPTNAKMPFVVMAVLRFFLAQRDEVTVRQFQFFVLSERDNVMNLQGYLAATVFTRWMLFQMCGTNCRPFARSECQRLAGDSILHETDGLANHPCSFTIAWHSLHRPCRVCFPQPRHGAYFFRLLGSAKFIWPEVAARIDAINASPRYGAR